MKLTCYKGWNNCAILTNGNIEAIITLDVGPRIIRFAFASDKKNMLAEIPEQIGGMHEKKWMIRGGHRLWIAPEVKPTTYELDNEPVSFKKIKNGIKTIQRKGSLSGMVKEMVICMDQTSNTLSIKHIIRNETSKPAKLSPWALTVMAPSGSAIIPLPKKIPHTKRLTHNQEWSIWSYTDLADKRYTIGSKFLLLKQNKKMGPTKIGLAHREKWVAYQLGNNLFVKEFVFFEGAQYPDGGVNFETFTNESFLELESLGPLVTVEPGDSISHNEKWRLFSGIPNCKSDNDIAKHILPLL